jgi:hypothetical protein
MATSRSWMPDAPTNLPFKYDVRSTMEILFVFLPHTVTAKVDVLSRARAFLFFLGGKSCARNPYNAGVLTGAESILYTRGDARARPARDEGQITQKGQVDEVKTQVDEVDEVLEEVPPRLPAPREGRLTRPTLSPDLT